MFYHRIIGFMIVCHLFEFVSRYCRYVLASILLQDVLYHTVSFTVGLQWKKSTPAHGVRCIGKVTVQTFEVKI